jgi:Ser/Thr protein kinase RdoA (MazF antagonist)
MADFGQSHRFPSPSHRWTPEEIKSILDTYARLHAGGQRCLKAGDKPDWLVARHEERLFETVGDLPDMVKRLSDQGIWPLIPNFESLLDRALREAELLADHPVTILHNDVYPPNCGIPTGGDGEAILVDWDMVGMGLAEMDLAFMFLQPFGSHRQLDRQAALNHYWHRRSQLDGHHPSKTERQFRQRYADALWALWLIPVAHRMASSSFPTGSPPQIYWDSMFGVLGERLLTLSDVA